MSEIAKIIISAAMHDATAERLDQVEAATWGGISIITDREARLAAIQYAFELGILSIEHKFRTTTDVQLAALLWNEFGEEIDTTIIPASPAWRREIVDTPRVQRPDTLQWHDHALRRANLPLRVARLQLGEIFGGEVEWGDIYRDVDIEWGEDDAGRGVPVTELGDHLYWNDDDKFYFINRDNDDQVARLAL